MQTKRRVILVTLLILLFAITAVSANDNVNVSDTNEEIIAEFDNTEIIDAGVDTGTFEELDSLIQNADMLKLNKSYTGSTEIVINRNITIDGQNFTLDAKDESRIFYIENSNVVLKNLNFINAKSLYGGAVYAGYASNLTIIGCTFINCSANFGGAITVLSSDAEISQSHFKYNTAGYDGGAIFSMYGDLKLTDNTFLNNTAARAGAVYSSLNSYTLINNKFLDNIAVNVGAVYVMAGNRRTVSGNIFSHNTGFDDVYETVNDNLTIYSDDYYYPFNYKTVEDPELPDYYDIRDYVNLTEVKNQGVEGNCWAFSAMAVLESCLLKASGIPFDFSEANLKNLMAFYSDWGRNIETNGGGNMWMASGYFASWLGPVSDEDDVYSTHNLLSPVLGSLIHIQNILYLKRTGYTSNDDFKNAIMTYGGVSTSMYYDKSYLNGYAYFYNGDEDSNHEVCIVGWNDSYSKSNFKNTPEGDGAWIVRNSWGPSWGDEGYFYVSYYDTRFAEINETDSYTIILNDTVRFNRVYQFESILTSFSYDEYSCYKNVFTVEGDENLAGASTYFSDKCDYEMTVYINDNYITSKRGSADAGYYTIILDEKIALAKDDNVTVVFNCTNFRDGKAAIPLSFKDSTVNLFITENRSYFWSGRTWADLAGSNAIACIKIFTTNSDAERFKPYFIVSCEADYFENSFLINLILPSDAEGLVELNTSNNHYILNLSESRTIKLYNLNDNNNTLTVRYCGDDKYLERTISYTVDIDIEATGNFVELADKISKTKTGAVLNLYKDYVLDSASTGEIVITSSITIDGHGHTISGANLSGIFNVQAADVILKNIRFIESNCNDDGAVHVYGDDCQIINCSFYNNTAYNSGGAICWQGINGIIRDCHFENNSAPYGGAIMAAKSITIYNSTFMKNHGYGAAVYMWSNNSIADSDFIENDGSIIVFVKGNNNEFKRSNFINNTASRTSLYIEGNNGSLNNCIFANCSSDDSAAALIFGNDFLMDNCIFAHNHGAGNGGAVSVVGSNCNLTNSRFINNSAASRYGGACYFNGKDFIIKNTVFYNNSASNGGAIILFGNRTVISNCSFEDNRASENGGAICWYSDDGVLFNSSFADNYASVNGGAVFWYSDDGVLFNSSFVDNNASGYGGAVYWYGREGTLANSTFDENSASYGDSVFWSGENGKLSGSTFINSADNYHIWWNNVNSGSIEFSRFINSTKKNIMNHGASIIRNDLGLVDQDYIIEYKNPNGLSVRFSVIDGVPVSLPVRFTISGKHYDIYLDNANALLTTQIANLDVGDITVDVRFNGDDTYNPLDTTFTLKLTKASSYLTLLPADATVNHESALAANVVDSNNNPITRGSVTFYDGESMIGSSDVVNGVAGVSYTPTSDGEHSIRAVYSDNDYMNSDGTVKVLVDSASISLSVSQGSIGAVSTFVANVKALYGTVGEGSVSFYIDDVFIDRITLHNAQASLSYAPKSAGSHTVKAVFDSSRFAQSEDSKSYSVSKATSQVSLEPFDAVVGYPSTITAKITSNALAIGEGTVVFFDGETNIGSVNLLNGIATLDYAPKTAGKHNISAVYTSDNYDRSSDYTIVSVEKAGLTISVNNPSNVYYMDTVNFAVTLLSNGNRINEGTVKFYVDDVLIGSSDVRNGVGNYNYKVSSLNPFELLVIFEETSNYFALNATKAFTVDKMQTTLTANPITAVYNVAGSLVVTLRSSNGRALSGMALSVNFNGARTLVTDVNGQIIFSSAGLAPGTYSVAVTYPGSDSYSGTSAISKITVLKATPKITAAKKTFKRKVKIKKYTITLKTNQNRPLSKVKVTLKVNGKSYSARTTSSGKATFKIKKLTKKGNFKAVITYGGNAYYNKVTRTVKIIIK